MSNEVEIDGVSKMVAWGDVKHQDLTGTIKSVHKGKVQFEDGTVLDNPESAEWAAAADLALWCPTPFLCPNRFLKCSGLIRDG